MHRTFYRLLALTLAILLVGLLWTSLLTAQKTVPVSENTLWLPWQQAQGSDYTNLKELITPRPDYAAWYESETDQAANPTYFGVYSFLPLDDKLYLGWGSARPAEDGWDGALLASTNGGELAAISPLAEQGFIGMISRGDDIFIPGADPTDQIPGEHQWDWGNTYLYPPPDPVVQYRNLPNVIHSWGLWYDASRQWLYAAVSSHLGDYSTWSGEIFVSDNDAQSWTRLADKEDGVGDYRTWDIIGFAGKLYATWNDVYQQPCGLSVSADHGRTWERIPSLDLELACRPRLFVFGDELLLLNFTRDGFYRLDTTEQITFSSLDFHIAEWAYNYLTADHSGNVYTITDDGRVLRSSDLEDWSTLASTDIPFNTVGYWPERDRLVLANRGRTDANLWQIDVATARSIPMPPPPDLFIADDSESLALSWSGPATRYHIYAGATPDFAPLVTHKIAVTTEKSYQIPNDTAETTYYVVRAENIFGHFSTASNRMGNFVFSLTAGE